MRCRRLFWFYFSFSLHYVSIANRRSFAQHNKIHAYILCTESMKFRFYCSKESLAQCVTWSITWRNPQAMSIEPEGRDCRSDSNTKSTQTRTMHINKHISLAHYRTNSDTLRFCVCHFKLYSIMETNFVLWPHYTINLMIRFFSSVCLQAIGKYRLRQSHNHTADWGECNTFRCEFN